MRRTVNRWLIFAAAASVFFIVGGASAHITPSVTKYSVQFKEIGLPTGTSWSVTFNGSLSSATTPTIKFSSFLTSSYSWSVTSPIQKGAWIEYVASVTYGYMYVPNQLTQVIVFTKQVQVGLLVTPANGGSATPAGPTYYPAGSQIAISASPSAGYMFTKWTSSTPSITLTSTTAISTVATLGGPGNVTATFTLKSYTVTFAEVGLPKGSTWQVTFNSLTYFSTTATLLVTGQNIGNWYWQGASVTVGGTVTYVPAPFSGYEYVPYTLHQTLVFGKQFLVQFAVSPSGSGSTNPTTSTFYPNGTSFPVAAQGTATTVFSSWTSSATSLFLGSKTSDSTNVTVRASGTITAKFSTAGPCSTTCSATFLEVGLPTGTAWGVTVNSVFYGTTGKSIKLNGYTPNTYVYWSATSPISGGTPGVAYTPDTTSGYLYVPNQGVQMIVYTAQDYVTFSAVPTYGLGSVTPSSGWYPAGSLLSINSQVVDTSSFAGWTSNSSQLTFANHKNASTILTISGPGSVTGNFAYSLNTVTFSEVNLPKNTTWGVTFNYVSYYTNKTTLILHGIAGSSGDYWTAVSPVSTGATNVAYFDRGSAGSMSVPFQTLQVVVYTKEVSVTIIASGTVGGQVSPSGTSWYINGTNIGLAAINSTTVSFSTWSSSAVGLNLFSKTQASTNVTLGAPGTLTAKFT
ncbi:MAG: hypothetical protein L3K23_02010 [Thermoplasmata archaeon]|nr:hypothetical protein [Thermoplasmata archaeon]